MATFLEGVESIGLWCSLVVLLPAVVLVLVSAGGKARLLGGAIVGTSTMMWARAGRIWEFEVHGVQRWVIGVAIVATFAMAFRAGRRPAVHLGLGILSGAISGWLWQPCVGEHFAEVLNRAESDRIASLLKMHAYVIGVSLPAVLLVALPEALPRTRAVLAHIGVRRGALVVAVIYGAAVAAGWYNDLVSELFRLSST